jgi:peroxiredoxin
LGALVEEINDLGGTVAGVAVTAVFSQLAFAEELGIDFPLLSDWDGEVCSAYGVRYDEWKGHVGLARRSLFVIDRQHVVRYAWSHEDAEVVPDLRPALEMMRSLVGSAGQSG